jgi:hypothetical protein
MKKVSLFLVFPFLMLGCNKSPFDRTTGGVVTGSGSGPAGSLAVFYNELSSGGGAFEYPSGNITPTNFMSLSFTDQTSPTISNYDIRYNWTGGGTSPTFAGFDLIHAADETSYTSDPGINLTSKGYTKLTFYARGSLSLSNLVKIQGAAGTPQPCLSLSASGTADDPTTPCGHTGVLTLNWQQYVILLPPASLNPIKNYFNVTIIYTGAGSGSGGTVYFDRIEYEP